MVRILGPYCMALVWGWLLSLRLRTARFATLWLLLGAALLTITVYGIAGRCLSETHALPGIFAVCVGSFALHRFLFALLRLSRVRSS